MTDHRNLGQGAADDRHGAYVRGDRVPGRDHQVGPAELTGTAGAARYQKLGGVQDVVTVPVTLLG